MEKSRKDLRLRNWDYSEVGCYFVTYCTHKHNLLFGTILEESNDSGSVKVSLSTAGLTCRATIENIPIRYPFVSLENYVVMPNHVHLLCSINGKSEGNGRSLLSRIVGFAKSETTKELRKSGYVGEVWQRGFYDHIVRNDADFERIFKYIDDNPAKWAEDKFHPEG